MRTFPEDHFDAGYYSDTDDDELRMPTVRLKVRVWSADQQGATMFLLRHVHEAKSQPEEQQQDVLHQISRLAPFPTSGSEYDVSYLRLYNY